MEEPKIKNGQYSFYEYVCGGYLQRGDYASHDIKTTWTKELKLVKFTIDKDDMMYLFKEANAIKKIDIENLSVASNIKWNLRFHYHRAIRAKSRHLKWLKIYLGLEKEPELEKTEDYVCTPGNFAWKLNIRKIGKTKKGELKVSQLPCRYSQYTKATKEKIKLMEQYNKQLNDLFELRKIIFSKEK